VRARDLEGLGGTSAVRFVTGSVCSLDIAGVELSGRGDSVVGGGDDIVGEVDQSSPGWLWQGDQSISRDLMVGRPGDAFVAVSPCSIAISASPWALMPMMRAGAVRPG
jgi:hypothetical protein